MRKITNNVYVSNIVEPNKPAVIEGDSLIVVDPGCDNPDLPISAMNEIKKLADSTGKTVSHVIITHAHPEHCTNTPRYHEEFGAKIIVHKNSPLDFEGMVKLSETLHTEEFGIELSLIPSPGHSELNDDLSIFVHDDKLLFCGDLAQPQGQDYNQATAYSPVPFFCHGENYLKTLGNLLEYPMEYILTGHGAMFKGYSAKHALDLTMTVLLRIRSLADKLTREHPEITTETLAEWIFDTISWERSFEKRLVMKRKKIKQHNGKTAFQEFDMPGIVFFIEQVRKNHPVSGALNVHSK